MINLVDKSTPAWTGKDGVGTFTVPAGKSLKIETSPKGETILDEVVPEGKTWQVTISISIVEA